MYDHNKYNISSVLTEEFVLNLFKCFLNFYPFYNSLITYICMTPCMTNYLKNHPINALLLFTTIDNVWDMGRRC